MEIFQENIATARPDNYLGTIALDRHSAEMVLQDFIESNFKGKKETDIKAIRGSSFPKGNNPNVRLKVFFHDGKVEEIEITVGEFFNLFTEIEFRVFSSKSNIKKDNNIDW